MRPPIAPIGLDYLAEALNAAGHRTELLDLCWEEDAPAAIASFFHRKEYGLAGITLRNTDDCGYTSRQSFLGEFAEIVSLVRRESGAPVVLGGVGFSVMPEQVMALTGADAGVWGEGEFVFPAMADRLDRGESCAGLSRGAGLLAGVLPPMTRQWVDNRRYFRHGGQAGFETKRGCSGRCIYCADPIAKGAQVRTRPPAAVADEIEALFAQGIDHLHTCDGEFNLPPWHALEVCREIARRGLGERVRWYAYCSPAPFSRELAAAMRAAGCVGVNFGADNGDAGMLRRLRRGFTPADIVNATRWAKEAGMAVMLDLLLGSPGESAASLARTIERMREADPDAVGVSAGVRVYPGTELARRLPAPAPEWFLEPAVAPFVFELLERLIGDDRRFLFFDPARPERNYNYSGHSRLAEAIERGARGAWWDILRKA